MPKYADRLHTTFAFLTEPPTWFSPRQDDFWHCYGCDMPRAEREAFCPSCDERTDGWKWEDQ